MRGRTFFKRLELGLLTLMGVSMSAIMIANAVLRYGVESSIIWAEEFVRINFVWAMFVAVTASFIRREHIGFDTLIRKTRLGRRMQEIACGFTLFVTGAVMAWYGTTYIGFTGDVVLPGTNLPSTVLLLPGVLAGAAWAFLGVTQMIQALRALITGKE